MQCELPAVLSIRIGVEAQLVRWCAVPDVVWLRAAEDPAVVVASTIWLGRFRPRWQRDLSSCKVGQ